jgi:hypothetical protein
MRERIHQWADISKHFKKTIVLGNGASIAVDNCFAYRSLFDEAISTVLLSSNAGKLFNQFKTKDFELILRMIRNAHHVNDAFGIEDDPVTQAYDEIRESLIKTVQRVHVPYTEALRHIPSIAQFLKQFDTVINLNYDLLVYWAMLHANSILGGYWFKDCFVGDYRTFKDDHSFLRQPHGGLNGATLVFYPHGNLVLASDFSGREVKICNDEHADLLDTIVKRWSLSDCTPLFVSEGATDQKSQAIHRNAYLRTIYNTVLPRLGKHPIAVYGWSIGEQDRHLLAAIGRNEPSRLAVSVHMASDSWEDFCEDVRKAVRATHGFAHTEVLFYDSSSPDCWINCKAIRKQDSAADAGS